MPHKTHPVRQVKVINFQRRGTAHRLLQALRKADGGQMTMAEAAAVTGARLRTVHEAVRTLRTAGHVDTLYVVRLLPPDHGIR